MTRDETRQLFDSRVDAWRRRDVDALVHAHTGDGMLESPLAGKVAGRAAIENVYRAFITSFPDLTVENPELVVDGDRVVQMLTFSGTNTGGFMGMSPTGKRFSFARNIMSPWVPIRRFRINQILEELTCSSIPARYTR